MGCDDLSGVWKMIDSLLTFIGYEAMNGWQKLAFAAIAAFLTAQIITAVKELVFYIYCMFSAYPENVKGRRDKEDTGERRTTRSLDIRLCDDVFLIVSLVSTGFGDSGKDEPPEAKAITIGGECVVDSRYLYDFLELLSAYLNGRIEKDKEYRIGEKLIAKVCRRIEYDGRSEIGYRFAYDLRLCANEKEYSLDHYNASLIYTSLKENLRKRGFVGLYGLWSYGGKG
jgi:hypothetical protein